MAILEAVSDETVEITKRTFEAYNAGDMEALRELYDPDIVYRHLPDWPEPGLRSAATT